MIYDADYMAKDVNVFIYTKIPRDLYELKRTPEYIVSSPKTEDEFSGRSINSREYLSELARKASEAYANIAAFLDSLD